MSEKHIRMSFFDIPMSEILLAARRSTLRTFFSTVIILVIVLPFYKFSGEEDAFLRHSFTHSRIQQQLFTLYGLLLIALAVLLLSVITPIMNRLLNESSQETVSQLAITINTQIDEHLRGMDQLARQVIYSDEIINDFLRPREERESLLIPLEQRRDISNELYTILAPSVSRYDRISLLDTGSGNYISAGTYSFQTLISLREISEYAWVQNTLSAGGQMYIVPPHTEVWGKNSGERVFSVARAFKSYSAHSEYTGIVEVPCSNQVLTSLINDAFRENKFMEKLFIFDQNGVVIYASNQLEANAYRDLLPALSNPESNSQAHDELLAYARSGLSGWQVVIGADKDLINTPVSNVISVIVLTIVAAVFCAMLLSYYVSRQFSKPIQEIYHSINQLQISPHAEQPSGIASGGNELEQLRDSFNDLCIRLDQAVNEAALARTCELESRVTALESQINPHFLYNTFAMIQTMADNDATAEISMICSDLSQLLRYSVAASNTPVTVGSEIEACSLYLGIMYRRHCTQLSYTIHMAPEVENCPVPRMILQPLVENCFKHAFQSSDMWTVDVDAVRDGDSWYITISDNGVGFPPDVMDYIQTAMKSQELLPYLDEGGNKHIGLINVGLRMKFFFGDDLIFDIQNLPEGGSRIRLGSKKGMRYE